MGEFGRNVNHAFCLGDYAYSTCACQFKRPCHMKTHDVHFGVAMECKLGRLLGDRIDIL